MTSLEVWKFNVQLPGKTAAVFGEMKADVEKLGVKYSMEMETRAERVKEVRELEKVLTAVLKEVHTPPTLMDLAVGKVVEEVVGVEELPATLKVKVEQWPSERREKSERMVDSMLTAATGAAAEKVEKWACEGLGEHPLWYTRLVALLEEIELTWKFA